MHNLLCNNAANISSNLTTFKSHTLRINATNITNFYNLKLH